MFEVLNYVSLFAECMICLSATTKMTQEKYSKYKSLIVKIVFSVIYMIAVTQIEKTSLTSGITVIFCAVYIFTVTVVLTNSSKVLTLAASSLTLFFMIAVDISVSSIVIMIVCKNAEITSAAILSMVSERVYAVFLLVDKLIQLCVFVSMIKAYPKLRLLTKKQLKLISIFSIIFIVSIRFFMIGFVKDVDLLIETAVIFCVVFVVLILMIALIVITLVAGYHNKDTKMQLMEVTSMMLKNNYNEMISSNEIIRQQVHDFKNHIITINGLLESDSSAKAYVTELLSTSYAFAKLCHSGNDTIDAIINCKAAEAKTENIDFNYVVNLNDDFKMSDIDICALLANQIDNAVEACKRIMKSKRYIEIIIEQKGKLVYFCVKNSVLTDEIDGRISFISTKKESGNHGYGIKIINDTTKKYNGDLKNSCSGNEFTSIAMVCIAD